jgi:hypothetical protein
MERDWATLGPKLEGKLHIYCGDMDNYYLNNAVYLTEEFLESTTAPYYNGEVDYGDRAEHCSALQHDVPAQDPETDRGGGSAGRGPDELEVLTPASGFGASERSSRSGLPRDHGYAVIAWSLKPASLDDPLRRPRPWVSTNLVAVHPNREDQGSGLRNRVD